MKQVFVGSALEAVLAAAAERPPSNEDSRRAFFTRRFEAKLRYQPVVNVWRRTETGEAPRRQGATTENTGSLGYPLTEVTPISSVSGAWPISRGLWASSRPGLRPRTRAESI